MKTIRRMLSTIALALTFGGAAQAATLYTPVLIPDTVAGESLACFVVNVAASSTTVTMDIVNGFGGVINTVNCGAILPGATSGCIVQHAGAGYCRVTVSGGKNRVRAWAELLSSTGFTRFQDRAE